MIVVDETVDPFDLKQVMWALSTKFHPAHDLIVIPDVSVVPLDPGASPPGMTHKMIMGRHDPHSAGCQGELRYTAGPPGRDGSLAREADGDAAWLTTWPCRVAPRCDTPGAGVVARSPVPGVWEMYLCQTCFYSWRSTELDEATKASAMSAKFRIDPAGLQRGHVMPTVPPLRASQGFLAEG